VCTIEHDHHRTISDASSSPTAARQASVTERPIALPPVRQKERTSITPFLRNQAFDPETVEVMGKAFVTTCEALGLTDRTDAMTKLVAEKVIELAQRGFRNPLALHLAVLNEFISPPNGAQNIGNGS
jgi:hypothetical protein